jgi:competence protein ComGC
MTKARKTKDRTNDQNAKDIKNNFSVTKMYINIMVILLLLVLILPNFDYFKNMIDTIKIIVNNK